MTGSGSASASDEARLLEAIQTHLAMPKARVAVWLHLSRLRGAATRPHQRRVAYAIMESAALEHEGDIFLLGNDDLVLLCRVPSHSGLEPAAHPTALPYTFSRLLQSATAMDTAELTRVWWLEHEGAALLAHIAPLAVRA